MQRASVVPLTLPTPSYSFSLFQIITNLCHLCQGLYPTVEALGYDSFPSTNMTAEFNVLPSETHFRAGSMRLNYFLLMRPWYKANREPYSHREVMVRLTVYMV